MWHLTKLWRLLLSSYGKDTSWSSRALAKLLSDQGANFESNIIKELCELVGILEVRTSFYHTQTNWQVERAHQMLMCMIGKLSRDQKAYWPKDLPELVMPTTLRDGPSPNTAHTTSCYSADHTYLSTFTSLQWGAWRNISMSTAMLLGYVNDCEKPSRKHKHGPYMRVRGRSVTMIGG